MLKRPERKVRDGPRQIERRRQRCDEVIAALRARRRAPADARDRVAVRNDGIARLASGNVIHRVTPGSNNGYERDLGRRRAPGRNQCGRCKNQCAQDDEKLLHDVAISIMNCSPAGTIGKFSNVRRLPVCTTFSKIVNQRSLVWPGCVKKLKFVPGGLLAG